MVAEDVLHRTQVHLWGPKDDDLRHYIRGSQFRLQVVAPSVLDAVRFAGGWIYDQVRIGWTVSVAVPDHHDDRPLRVLGADTLDFDSVLATVDAESNSSALAVAAALFDQNDRVQHLVRIVLAGHHPQLLMWGEHRTAELRPRLGAIEYRLSSAARSFKAHSLRAASAEPTVSATEFRVTSPSIKPLTGSSS
jgi:hypothetical protein